MNTNTALYRIFAASCSLLIATSSLAQMKPSAAIAVTPPAKNSLIRKIVPAKKLLPGKELDGGWESSGGDGVACFREPEVAAQARLELKEKGTLSAGTRGRIESVRTLESWDLLNGAIEGDKKVLHLSSFTTKASFAVPTAYTNMRYPEIMAAVIKNIEPLAPLLSYRIEMAALAVPLSQWIGTAAVGQVDDSKPLVPVEDSSSCVLIQLANRKSISEADKIPRVVLYYDQEIFEKHLSELDKAVLLMHEYIYMIAKEGAHKDSDMVRRVNAFFFSTDIVSYGSGYNHLGMRALAFRQIIGYPFGDYMRFFKAEDDARTKVQSQQSSRYNAMIAMMEKFRDAKTACLDKEGFASKTEAEKYRLYYTCQTKGVFENAEVLGALTDEEAFVFMGRFHFDQLEFISGPKNLNSEALAVPGPDSEETRIKALAYCNLLGEHPSMQYLIVQAKAAEYCRTPLGHKTN